MKPSIPYLPENILSEHQVGSLWSLPVCLGSSRVARGEGAKAGGVVPSPQPSPHSHVVTDHHAASGERGLEGCRPLANVPECIGMASPILNLSRAGRIVSGVITP